MVALVTVVQLILICGVVLYFGTNVLDMVRLKPAAPPLSHMPLVSVCVPARNEERAVGDCVRSLLNQDYPNYEVIVVDDGSTDRTPDILAALHQDHPQLKVIQGEALPEGWYGKPFALHQASRVAQGDVLMFTDADPVFRPNALTSAVHALQTQEVDLLSLKPHAVFGTFWERAVQPLVFALIGGLTRFRKINSPEHPHAMGFGAFIMIRKEIYQRVGGHEAVKQRILEDITLAKVVKKGGGRLLVADGKALFSIRMYHSLGEIWEGWRKNVFLALKQSILKTLYYAVMILGFTVTPWLLLFFCWVLGEGFWLGVAAFGLVLVLVTEVGLCEELDLAKPYVLAFPLGGLVLTGILINSMLHVRFRKQSVWRGRSYVNPT